MRPFIVVAAILLFAPTAVAGPRIVIPEELQNSALLCLGEALRLCPNALAAKDHGVSCILGKRRLLSRPCRALGDQGVRLLNGQDVHLHLRQPAAPR